MKTTIEIQDELKSSVRREPYELPDLSVGEAGSIDPLEAYSWQDLRDEIYGKPTPQYPTYTSNSQTFNR